MSLYGPLTDRLPSLSIGALEFDPTDATHRTLIAGSARLSTLAAEGGARIGVLRSTDGGDTWAILGRDTFANEDITSVAARGDVLLAASDPTWIADLEIDPRWGRWRRGD